ncbi:GntR family transcriptional regulator [Azospirillum sp.]|uniref:GntR family transcriptional regulator n=1 Tax=Azospirillum sp. TaxID=34012 RepID=UPI002D2B9C3B|nr:GntR family transcriptional regulator [Azospirillum sp.]HYD71174.1 GntR family transcriptional regulator [Azospirillum sp.]
MLMNRNAFPPVSGLPDQASPPDRPARGRAPAPRTIPEQIADEIGALIIAGDYKVGDRLIEQDLATRFGVSRGPVRESLRILERRRMVDMVPRRGAYVRPLSLETFVDLFNVRIALMSLAVRLMAAGPVPSYLETLRRRVAEIEAMAADDATDPRVFAHATARAAKTIAHGSANDLIVSLLTDLTNQTLWTTIWTKPVIYRTRAEREQYAKDIRAILGHIEAGEGVAADSIIRRALEDGRDAALKALMAGRTDTVDPQKLLRTA